VRIYVPSRGRYSTKFIGGAQSPLRWAPQDRLTYVVRDDEYDRYRRFISTWWPQIEVVACGAPENLSKKRVWIAQFAQSRGEELHMQCDDDVKLYVRKSPDVVNLRDVTAQDVQIMLERVEEALDRYPMVGISAREGNNYAGVGEPPMIKECTRSMRLYAFRTEDLLSIDSGRMPEMADFDTVLQFLERGQKNAVLYYWAQHQPKTQHPGGCAAYRTHATHEAAAYKLSELHPGVIRIVQKENKGGGEFGTRTEVAVQWQKAWRQREAAE